MDKSVILVTALTFGVLLIVGSLFMVGAFKPVIGEVTPDPDQYCKDNAPTDKCNAPASHMCKDDMPDGKHICEYVCIGGSWSFSQTCNALDGCSADRKTCKKTNVAA